MDRWKYMGEKTLAPTNNLDFVALGAQRAEEGRVYRGVVDEVVGCGKAKTWQFWGTCICAAEVMRTRLSNLKFTKPSLLEHGRTFTFNVHFMLKSIAPLCHTLAVENVVRPLVPQDNAAVAMPGQGHKMLPRGYVQWCFCACKLDCIKAWSRHKVIVIIPILIHECPWILTARWQRKSRHEVPTFTIRRTGHKHDMIISTTKFVGAFCCAHKKS